MDRSGFFKRFLACMTALACWVSFPVAAELPDYRNFESHQFRPMALSPSGERLFVTNTPDNRVEIFAVSDAELEHLGSVRVGMEPVAVAARTDNEIWVVNHLSDSVSVVDIEGNVGSIRRTLLVGDEPRDIVFAGGDQQKAFITTAHRGQNSPYNNAKNPGELITPGIGRADVWIFDAEDQGEKPGGKPLAVASLFGDSPGPLTVSADGSRVYVGVFKSGNQTTIIGRVLVCDGGADVEPCQPLPEGPVIPGGLPWPNETADGSPMPEAGLIVRHDGEGWKDELDRDWSDVVAFDLPDLDVFELDAAAAELRQVRSYATVGTILYAMGVNPANGKVYVANTEARNEVRFEGPRSKDRPYTTIQGHLHETRITLLDPADGSVTPRHLNTHIDYNEFPVAKSVRDRSLSMPVGMAFSADGETVYVAAKGSDKIAVVSTESLEEGSYEPVADEHIYLPGGGPAGLVLDGTGKRLFALTRYDNAVNVVDTKSGLMVQRLEMPTPEPADVIAGRPLFFNAYLTSGNGESSCASCHVGGDKDELAWDLGDPNGVTMDNPGEVFGPLMGQPGFHPMKGPMLTQTMRGISTHGAMHWRGDRTAGNDKEGDPLDARGALRKFNPTFVNTMGREEELGPAQLEQMVNYGLSLVPPPNPIRALDNSLTPMQAQGKDFYENTASILGGGTCATCHTVDESKDFYGTRGTLTNIIGGRLMKVPHQRNMYERAGMFGRAATRSIPFAGEHMGAQIRGYGYTHDGGADTMMRFMSYPVFRFEGGMQERRAVEQYMFAFESDLKPVVGQQITLTRENVEKAGPRAALFIRRALAGDAQLMAHSTMYGKERGFLMDAEGRWLGDYPDQLVADINELATAVFKTGASLTLTAVPPGSGVRMALDRERDGIPDATPMPPKAAANQ